MTGKQLVVVCCTHYGGDWHAEDKEVFDSESKSKHFEIEHREDHKNVNGIEFIE
ncbi:hypothetical protein [Oceanobacillus kimchii]|uniref:Uncharacterized protein n=1 Tax=Oceanobacillus kimchii TaxID=746691 RepID=A0ABQ5TIS7_9BACI|nr:hypothetical protein [Oceanobacillus kimchii]GLO66181.1 hypothetical protein MACH08_19650 [Oceanobacillus kimchii]